MRVAISKLQHLPCSSVFSESVVAFCASEKLGRGFVTASSLHLPDVSKVVSTFWTRYSGGRQGTQLVLFSDHGYRFFGRTFYRLGNIICVMFPWFFVSTFWAYYLKSDFCSVLFAPRNQARSTLWTKLHNTHHIFCDIASLPTFKYFLFETLPNQQAKRAQLHPINTQKLLDNKSLTFEQKQKKASFQQ